MKSNFKVVPKLHQNVLCILAVCSNGTGKEIGRVIFPNDFQVNDNVACAEEICTAIRKRIRKSIS